MSETQTQQSGNFINLLTQGIGYLSRIRTVTPKRSKDSFLACTINAMHGNKDEKNGMGNVGRLDRVSRCGGRHRHRHDGVEHVSQSQIR